MMDEMLLQYLARGYSSEIYLVGYVVYIFIPEKCPIKSNYIILHFPSLRKSMVE
jgi:hypothetical protein